MTAAGFAIAAGLGAAARYGAGRMRWPGGRTWLGTLAVNVAGSFALGWLLASQPPDAVATVAGTGFLGSLTTFSMFAIEASGGRPGRRAAVIATNVCLGLAAAAAGHALA